MARITVEDCLRNERNRFLIARVASNRAVDLLSGKAVLSLEKRPRIRGEKVQENKMIVSALREIAESRIKPAPSLVVADSAPQFTDIPRFEFEDSTEPKPE